MIIVQFPQTKTCIVTQGSHSFYRVASGGVAVVQLVCEFVRHNMSLMWTPGHHAEFPVTSAAGATHSALAAFQRGKHTMKITVETTVAAPIEDVWRAYTTPEDIKAASDDWHTTRLVTVHRTTMSYGSMKQHGVYFWVERSSPSERISHGRLSR